MGSLTVLNPTANCELRAGQDAPPTSGGGGFYGSSIVLIIHSVDHSLSIHLIPPYKHYFVVRKVTAYGVCLLLGVVATWRSLLQIRGRVRNLYRRGFMIARGAGRKTDLSK